MKFEIFVNTWANYNENGAFGGEWLSLPMDEEELRAELDRISEKLGEDSPEWFVADYAVDGVDGVNISEYTPIHIVNRMAEELAALDNFDTQKLNAIVEGATGDCKEALKYMSSFDFVPDVTLKELAEQFFEESGVKIPKPYCFYIDFEAIARDMACEGYIETSKGVLIE